MVQAEPQPFLRKVWEAGGGWVWRESQPLTGRQVAEQGGLSHLPCACGVSLDSLGSAHSQLHPLPPHSLLYFSPC